MNFARRLQLFVDKINYGKRLAGSASTTQNAVEETREPVDLLANRLQGCPSTLCYDTTLTNTLPLIICDTQIKKKGDQKTPTFPSSHNIMEL